MRSRFSRRSARDKALELLTGSDKTGQRLRQDLRRRDYSDAEIDPVLAEFQERGFLDDARTGESLYARFCARGWGLQRIRMELRSQGVPRECIDAVAQTSKEQDERERALLALQRLKRHHGEPDRLLRALLRRGFAPGLCRELIRSLSA